MVLPQPEFLLSRDVTDKILRSMQEGLLIFNSDDQIQTVNQTAIKILGLHEERELVKRNVTEIFSDRNAGYEFLIHLEKEKQLNQTESVFVKPSGEKIFCLLSACIIQDHAEGELLKVIIFQDITERKLAELKVIQYSEKLEKSVAELDQFAYIVSHDLKAPLRAITNLAQWLYEDLEKDLTDENKRSLEMLRGRALRMESLVNGILEYSKIGRVKLNPELFDSGALVAEIIDLLFPGGPPKNVRIKVQHSMPILRTSKILLHQVFSNLISNALKYNDKPEPVIEIDIMDRQDHYEFSVKDNGPGIPKEYHEKVFVIFQTLQARDKVESTGIGLTIVKRIIEEQGGRVWINPDSETGTEFIFTWPKMNHNLSTHEQSA